MKSNQSATEILKPINILNCFYWIKDASSEVKTETIKNCFIKSGFKLKTRGIEMIEENDLQEMDLLLEQILDSNNAEEFVNLIIICLLVKHLLNPGKRISSNLC